MRIRILAYKYSEPQNDFLSFDEFRDLILREYDFDDSKEVSPMGSDSSFGVVGQVTGMVLDGTSWLSVRRTDETNPETIIGEAYLRPLDRNHFLAIIGSYRVGHWGDRRNLGRRMERVRGVVESVRVEPWDAPLSGEKVNDPGHR